jgi:ubiquinone biosynthesis protein COQ4
VRHLLSNSQFKALVDEGWRPARIDLQKLQTLPEDSL